jgi:alpha-glucosidase
MRDWWRGGVVYQVYPRSFRDGNGDGIGDLPGLLTGLDHIASLGVDAVWISPFFKSPMKDFGYDVEDYRRVDPLFGTNEDFDRVLAKAHALGLKVVIDLVFNHTADTHGWFKESRRNRTNPKADWYVWADPKPDGTPPNNWLSVFGGSAWQWDARREQYYFHQFLTEQPDLNVRNPEVQDALLEVLAFWLDHGVDGIRLDACNHFMHDPLLRDNPARLVVDKTRGDVARGNPYGMQDHLHDRSQPENLEFIARVRALCDRYDDRMVVAEVSCDNPVKRAAEYTSGPDRLHTAYSFALLGTEVSAAKLRSLVEESVTASLESWPSWALSNHDVARVRTRWGGVDATDAYARMALALLGSLRGSVFLYQGEELGLPQAEVPFERMLDPYGIAFYPEFKGRDGCRTPIPWDGGAPFAGFSDVEPPLPIPAEHTTRAISTQAADPHSVLSFARSFLAWRKTEEAVLTGTIDFLDAPEPVVAFVRTAADGRRLLFAFNLGGMPVGLPLASPLPPPVAAASDPSVRAPRGKTLELPAHGFYTAALDAAQAVPLAPASAAEPVS